MTPFSLLLFSNAATPSVASTLFSLFIFSAILVAVFCRKLAFDVFRADSPARSPKRLVTWRPEAALALFLCGAVLFPIVALVGVQRLPKDWIPDLAAIETSASDSSNGLDAETADGSSAVPTKNDLSTQHPTARLLIRAQSTDWGTFVLLVCFFVVVIAAPLQEEFVYRVLFQGTLENVALQAVLPRPRAVDDETASSTVFLGDELRPTDALSPTERRVFRRRAVFAVLLPAIVFALAHSGAPESPEDAASPERLNFLFRAALATGIANVATLLLGVFVLRRFSSATPESLGLGAEFSLRRGRRIATLKRFALDFLRGVVIFVFIAPIVFGVNVVLRQLCPNAIVDPAPIFLLALTLGFVYWKTRRYATVVGTHFALNATSFFALCVNFVF